jgi:hypothetical protein
MLLCKPYFARAPTSRKHPVQPFPSSTTTQNRRTDVSAGSKRLVRHLKKMPDELRLSRLSDRSDFTLTPAANAAAGLKHKLATVSQRLRSDVYCAFTQVRIKPLYYDADHDCFRRESFDKSTEIMVPRIKINQLIADRRRFAESLPDETLSEALLSTLHHQGTALALFKQAVDAAGLQVNWCGFNAKQIRRRVQCWASLNGLPFRSEWQRAGWLGL